MLDVHIVLCNLSSCTGGLALLGAVTCPCVQEDWRYWVFTMYSVTSPRVQEDWRYWVFTSIMGHFVHSFAQEVSNISPAEMDRDALQWVQVRE